MFSYSAFLAVLVALKVTISVINKMDISYNIVVSVLYVVITSVSDYFDVISPT